MLKDLGLDPNWESRGFSDQEETGGGGGPSEDCPAATADCRLTK